MEFLQKFLTGDFVTWCLGDFVTWCLGDFVTWCLGGQGVLGS